MLSEIEREKRIAEHLFYVSLKYTKTTDVILNLLNRWKTMIDISIEYLLEKAKKAKKFKAVSDAPKAKELLIREIYKKNKVIIETMEIYTLFRKMPSLDKIRESEFRKNVAVIAMNGTKEIKVDMEKLKEWNEKMNIFFNEIKKIK